MHQATESKLSTPGAIVIAGLIIAIAIIVTQGNFNSGPKLPEIVVNKITDKDHILGNAKAKIMVIEFSDTECPFCKMFHPTIKKIVSDYNGEVGLVYRHFPLVNLHKKAPKEAEATECAAEQGGNDIFWKYLDTVFDTTQSNDKLDPAMLPKIAGDLGLNVAKFNECLTSGKYKALVDADMADGIKAGVTGTPSSVIINTKTGKKKLIVGADSYENVKAAIDSLK